MNYTSSKTEKVTTIQAEQFQNQCSVQKKMATLKTEQCLFFFIKQNKWKRNFLVYKCILFDTLYNNYDNKQK